MKNSCKITFDGLNINRLLTVLSQKGIAVYDLRRNGRKCEIEVNATRSKQTIALLQERCYNIIGIKYTGISSALQFLKKRFVLPIICLLIVAVTVLSEQFCFKIVVSGDFDRDVVLYALDCEGVGIGCNLARINVDKLENSLANDIGAMYAVVTKSGSVLYVNVLAKKQIEPPIDMTKRRDIVATRDGVVTSVLCEQGTSLVKVGDVVKQGDVLIEGRRIYNDGTSDDVYALGRVALQISVSGFAEFTGYTTQVQQTGNVFTNTGVVLFGKEYAQSCPFERYTVNKQVVCLYPLNLKICKNTYFETRTVTVATTIDQCIDELKQLAYQQALANCDFIVTETQYTPGSNGVTATLFGLVEIR